MIRGASKKNFGKSWEFGPTGLTPPSPNVGIFSVNLPEIFGKKRVKYAIKTVIYKSWDWVRLPLLGPKSQLLPKICFGGFPKCKSKWDHLRATMLKNSSSFTSSERGTNWKYKKIFSWQGFSSHLSMVWVTGKEKSWSIAAIAGAKDLRLVQHDSWASIKDQSIKDQARIYITIWRKL